MKGLAKILIAIDLGVGAIVAGMAVYVNSDTVTREKIVPKPHIAPPLDPLPASDSAALAPMPDAAPTGGLDLTTTETWLIIAATVVAVGCILLWFALVLYQRHRAEGAFAENDDALPEPDAAPALAAELPSPRDANNLFRAAAQRTDQPVFGRAVRRPETA